MKLKRRLLKYALYVSAILALIIAIDYAAENDPGYVLVSLGGTSVEMSFWVLLLLAFFGSFLTWFFLGLFKGSYRVVRQGARTLLFGSEALAHQQTVVGLTQFMEGNWRQARRYLIRALKKSPMPLINYLAAARSAYELGSFDEVNELLSKAKAIAPKDSLAVVLTQARMLLLDKKYEQCLAALEKAREISPHHPVVLDLLKQVYINVQDWKSLQEILPELKRQSIGGDKGLAELEYQLYREILKNEGEQARRLPKDEAAAKLKAVWESLPKSVTKQIDMVEGYVRFLIHFGQEQAAENIMRRKLNKEWSECLVRLYGCVAGEDAGNQLLTAEKWLQERPNSAGLMLTLGRLSLRNQLWGKAREYFECSLRTQRDGETFAELARLLANLGEHEQSTELYQQGLLLMTRGLPVLPMPSSKT